MRCCSCGRLLSRAAVEIKKMGGSAVFGPKCAKRAGVLPEKQPRPSARPRRRKFAIVLIDVDPRQQDLFGVAA